MFAFGTSSASAFLAATLLWLTLPVEYLALGYGGLTVLILEGGAAGLPPQLRVFFAPAGLLAVCTLLLTQIDHFVKFPVVSVSLSFFGTAAAAGFVAWRVRRMVEERNFALTIAGSLLMGGCWLIVPDPFVSLTWTAIALAILELDATTRWISLALFSLTWSRLFLYDLSQSPLTSMPAAVAFTYWLWRRWRDEDLISRAVFQAATGTLLALIAREAGARNTAAAGWPPCWSFSSREIVLKFRMRGGSPYLSLRRHSDSP